MGVRLYPSTGDEDTLEKLAGVPSGTAELLDTFEDTRPPENDYQAMEAWYDKLFADDDLHTFYSFHLYGWGKLNASVHNWMDAHGYDPCIGRIDDQNMVAEVLALQGVDTHGVTVTSITWG